MALLEVYIKPETQKLEDLNSVFSVSQDKGDKWLSHNIQISQTNQPFQVRLQHFFLYLVKNLNIQNEDL